MNHTPRLSQSTMFIMAVLFALLVQFASAPFAASLMAAGCQVSPQGGWKPYRIHPGDTLSQLAKNSKVSVHQLMQANCLTSDLINAGALILVPYNAVPGKDAVNSTAPANTTTATAPANAVVAAPTAELLAAVAQKAGISPEQAAILAEAVKAGDTSPAALVVAAQKAGITPAQALTLAEELKVAGVSPETVMAATTTTTEVKNALAAEIAKQSLLARISAAVPAGQNFLLLFLLGVASVVSIALFGAKPQWQRFNLPAMRLRLPDNIPAAMTTRSIPFVGQIPFLVVGFLGGLVAFPLFGKLSSADTPSLTTLPLSINVGGVMLLIVLLAVKEMVATGNAKWKTMDRVLSIGIAPLLLLFAFTVATRLSELM